VAAWDRIFSRQVLFWVKLYPNSHVMRRSLLRTME
jgi:hypothetical protein